MKDWAEITKTRRLNMLERVVFPAIGKLPVKEITPHHILRILQETAKRGAPTVAAVARRTISSVFELAVATLELIVILSGPCASPFRPIRHSSNKN
jgi:integrase